ncbi:MAG: FAD binding domain-containing protein [Planctomycetota bacterium]
MSGARDRVVFYLNGQRREACGGDAVLSVSDYLRHRCGLVGTKIVCAEGDCGSCTVLVGRLASEQHLRYQPIDSCIQFVFQLDGAHLVTVDGLSGDGELTAVQRAMVDCHGSQCGFCTPGFVMAMTALAEAGAGEPFSEEAYCEGLTGNLCRCTGYSQIVEAGQQAWGADAGRLDARFPPAEIAGELAPLADRAFDVADPAGGGRVYSPVELEDALRFRSDHPGCCVVAGATDLGVQRNKGKTLPGVMLDLSRVASLDEFTVLDNESQGPTLAAGALSTWADLLDWSRGELPEFAKTLSVFGSPQIRHAGTLGGNIVNASPIADSLPLLYVMDAQLVVASSGGNRAVAITDFYRGYKDIDLRPDELLTEVLVPLPAGGELLKLSKVSRRRDMDISTFTAAIRMTLDGETIASASLAYGAVGPTVLRLPQTESMLVGQPFTEATMLAAGDAAVEEITPLSDVRGSADYRLQLARNVLLKFYAERTAELFQSPA